MFEPTMSFRSFIKKLSKLDIKTERNAGEDLIFHCCLQSPNLTDHNGKVIVDYIGRFENLHNDFKTVCKTIGLPNMKLRHLNRTHHKHYSKYYDEQTKQIVTQIYKKDIEAFDYKFEKQKLIDSTIDNLQFATNKLIIHAKAWLKNH